MKVDRANIEAEIDKARRDHEAALISVGIARGVESALVAVLAMADDDEAEG